MGLISWGYPPPSNGWTGRPDAPARTSGSTPGSRSGSGSNQVTAWWGGPTPHQNWFWQTLTKGGGGMCSLEGQSPSRPPLLACGAGGGTDGSLLIRDGEDVKRHDFCKKTLMAWFKKVGKLCLIFCKNGTWTENDTDFVKNYDFCQETVMAWFKKFGELCLIFFKNGAWSRNRLLFVKNDIFQFFGGVGPPIRWGSFMGA